MDGRSFPRVLATPSDIYICLSWQLFSDPPNAERSNPNRTTNTGTEQNRKEREGAKSHPSERSSRSSLLIREPRTPKPEQQSLTRAVEDRGQNFSSRGATMSSLFIASIGNPAPYEHTLHSAGHILLGALAAHLEAPTFAKDPGLADGLTSEARSRNSQQTRLTLWQSPSYMNESGPALVQAYKKWLARESLSPLIPPPRSEEDLLAQGVSPGLRDYPYLYRPRLNLVLVHDALDTVPGKFQVRYGGPERSARGHHGVTSVVKTLVQKGFLNEIERLNRKERKAAKRNDEGYEVSEAETRKLVLESPVLMRLQMGIGRPGGQKNREPWDVSQFVLQQMCTSQFTRTCAQGSAVAQYLQGITAE